MNLENKNVNALRMLAVDMIENAGSGHPGIALGAMPILYTLYSKHLNVVPDDDKNIFRDRFVLSAGHGSAMLYANLFAFGYKISLDDLKNFRKLGSITPGHPEYGVVPGIDATTGPLGQGVAMAVGMAIATKLMAHRFNKPNIALFDNYTYTLVGEGCLMEGVSYEALSLAGSLKLNNLIVLYDCNNITIDGNTKNVMNMDVLNYVSALGFNAIEVKDGNDVEEISKAIESAKKCKDRPSFIKINTHIGFGCDLQDSNKCHGSVLGADVIEKLRQNLDVHTKPFEVSKDVLRDLKFLQKRFESVRKSFKDKVKYYSKEYPNEYKILEKFMNDDLNFECLNNLTISENLSGREIGGLVLNELSKANENIICASADIFSSTKAVINDSGYINDNFGGRNLKCGIREFAMHSICNGIALFGGLIPIDSTFLVFSDYFKGSVRISALMNQKTISVLTHDSIAVGKDGPTHQPCEQLWALRNIPNVSVYRPANLCETVASYILALTSKAPSVIALSRQKLNNFSSELKSALMGGYVVAEEEKGQLSGVILATGSEVGLALDVKRILDIKGYNVRVVSMPCLEVFDSQSEKYKNSIIPPKLKSVFSIEAGVAGGWHKYVGKFGKCFSVDDFGLSGDSTEVYNKFCLTSEDIAKDIIKVIRENKEKTFSIIE